MTVKISREIKILRIYTCNKKIVALKKIFGTSSLKHPGVKDFILKGKWFIGGKTILKKIKMIYQSMKYFHQK